jgi:N-methylhydantoinase A
VATEEVVFRGGERLPTAFYERARLPLGEPVEGPAVILQADTTTLLAPGSRAELDDAGNLLITLEEG